MESAPKTGNEDLIIATLATHLALITLKDGLVTVASDTSRRDALLAEMRAQMDKCIGVNERQRTLCNYQIKEYTMGVKYLSLGQNIYGWAVQDFMSSNIGGGRAAITIRGASLEYCITVGCENAMRPNVEFHFPLKSLPERVQTALTEMLSVRGD